MAEHSDSHEGIRYGDMRYGLKLDRFGAAGLRESARAITGLRHAGLVQDVMEELATLGPGDRAEITVYREDC